MTSFTDKIAHITGRLPFYTMVFISIVMFWHLLYFTTRPERSNYIIGSDAAGYYAYLPANFIYHDLEYKFCIDGEHKIDYPGATWWLFMNRTIEGKLINKYFIGTAVLESPFFFVAYGTAPWFGHHANGYSFPFQMSVAIAAIFYCLIGLYQIRRLLSKLGITAIHQSITLVLLFFGTQLYYYTLCEPGMSHVFSFSMVALLLNQTYNVFHLQNKKSILWMMFAMIMIVAIRPVNGVMIFAIPFIAGSWENFIAGLRFCFAHYGRLAIGAGIFAVIVFFQLLMYKRTTGHWIADSYSGEHLVLSRPHIPEVLFSWKKGWFIYTPLMFLALGGILFLRNNFSRIMFVITIFSAVYVISCWELWWYGGSFGMRPLLEYSPLMAIPLALLIQKVFRRFWLIGSVPVFGFVLALSMVQHFQYFNGILPYNDMTEFKYRKLFFETNPHFTCAYYPSYLLEHTLPENVEKKSSFVRTFEEPNEGQHLSYWGITSEKSFSPSHSTVINAEINESSGCAVTLREGISDSTLYSKSWMLVKAKVFVEKAETDSRMIFKIFDSTQTYLEEFRPLYMNVEKTGEWQDFTFAIHLPANVSPSAQVAIFLAHVEPSVAYADDMYMEFYTEK